MNRTSTRVPVPTTNLKERIAALEQRQASKAPNSSRPVSPSPLPGGPASLSSTSSSAAPAGAHAFRDKIAKFERKGGVPVPRGRFGLGAPPPNTTGPSRQGELYGNRIPAPARAVSVGGGVYPPGGVAPGSAAVSRAASPTGTMAGDRRSFSLSSVGDFEDQPDYTPITSPTFAFPPDSPETVMSSAGSQAVTPEVSPSLSATGDAATFVVKPIVRGTSFQKALEIARNAEQAKMGSGITSPEALTPMHTGTSNATWKPAEDSGRGVRLNELEASEVVLSPQDTGVGPLSETEMEMETQLQLHSHSQSSNSEDKAQEQAQAQAQLEVQASPRTTSTSPSPPVPSPSPSSSTAEPSPSPTLTDNTVLSPLSPPILTPTPPQVAAPQPTMPIPAPTIPVTPLTIRKRGLSLSQSPSPPRPAQDAVGEVPPVPVLQLAQAKDGTEKEKERERENGQDQEEEEKQALSKEDEARGIASLASPDLPSSLQSSPGVPPPRYSSLHHTFFTVQDGGAAVPASSESLTPASPDSQRVRPLPQVPLPGDIEGEAEVGMPSIVVSHSDASRTPERKGSTNSTTSNYPGSSTRKATLALKPEALKASSTPTSTSTSNSLGAPAVNSNSNSNFNRDSSVSTTGSITDALVGYFKGPATPPMSPAAKLAYDASPEASPGPGAGAGARSQAQAQAPSRAANGHANANAHIPPSIHPPDPSSFLSPPQTGLGAGASTAGSSAPPSSMGSFSSLGSGSGSRPYSMIETSLSPTTQVHTALRMTPATSRGVPVFLPPTGTGRMRKSDWAHFPPTPDREGEGGEEQGREGEGEQDREEAEAEYGSVLIGQHKATQSMGDLNELALGRAHTVSGATRTFTAVVHGKVREATVPLPSSASASASASSTTFTTSRRNAVPQTPQQTKRSKRETILETPLSPGHGELAALLQEAMLLEDTLSRGALPAELDDASATNKFSSSTSSLGERKKLETISEKEAEVRAKGGDEREKEREEEAEAEERRRIAAAQAQLQAKRDEPTSGKLKHTFLIPLSKARSQSQSGSHRKEVSAPAPAPVPVSARGESFFSSDSTSSLNRLDEPPVPVRPKSAGVPEQTRGHGQGQGQGHKSRPVTPEHQAVTPTPRQPQTPSKSPSSRFGSFSRRIGNTLSGATRPSTIHGASGVHAKGTGHGTRHSNSTSSEISSVDSQPVATPPEGMLEFGAVVRPQYTGASTHSAVPSVSVSMSGEYGRGGMGGMGGMGNGNGSQTSFPSLSPKKSTNSLGRATSFAEKMWSRARTKSSGSNLSSTSEMTIDEAPRLPALGPPPALELPSMQPRSSIEKDAAPRVVNPPKRSTSLKRYNNDLPPIPTEPLPPLPVITSSAFDSQKTSTSTGPAPSTPAKYPKTPITSKSGTASHSQAPQLPQLPDVSISDISNDSLLTPGFTADSASRSSWTSMSSAGSLPSPLFDKELFDAFPSVPGSMPQPHPQPGDVFGFGGRRETVMPMGAAAAAVVSGHGKQPLPFDAALLNSAIHLQGRRSGETAR